MNPLQHFEFVKERSIKCSREDALEFGVKSATRLVDFVTKYRIALDAPITDVIELCVEYFALCREDFELAATADLAKLKYQMLYSTTVDDDDLGPDASGMDMPIEELKHATLACLAIVARLHYEPWAAASACLEGIESSLDDSNYRLEGDEVAVSALLVAEREWQCRELAKL